MSCTKLRKLLISEAQVITGILILNVYISNFMSFSIFIILCILSLPALYLIETITWMIRGLAKPARVAWVISKTNIILYFSRFMYLTYVTIMYFLIESGLTRDHAYKILALAFLTSAAFHIFLIRSSGINFVKRIALRNGIEVKPIDIFQTTLDLKLVLCNVFAVLLISGGIILPIFLAYMFPERRLTLSVSSQVMNAFGSYIILSKIDPVLSHEMDLGNLDLMLKSHIIGRMIGLAMAALIMFLLIIFSVYIN